MKCSLTSYRPIASDIGMQTKVEEVLLSYDHKRIVFSQVHLDDVGISQQRFKGSI